MIRTVLRALGFLTLAAAFAALVVDGSRSVAGGRLLQYSLGDALAWLGEARLVSGAVSGWPAPAATLAASLLAVPAWMAAAALGLTLLYAGRPPSPAPGLSHRRS